MKQKWTALLLSGALLCAVAVPTMAAEQTPEAPTVQLEQTLPHSVLYYGKVTGTVQDDQGAVTRLELESETYGTYTMLISSETVWIDAGRRTASDSAGLQVGEGVYVFHSPVSTRSLPPQSAALAVVRNIPMDASCPNYHLIEGIAPLEDGGVCITTDNGGLLISAGSSTSLSAYDGGSAPTLNDLKPGMRIMAWYDIVLTSYPGQTYSNHIMLLPQAQTIPEEGGALKLTLDGTDVELTGRYENGTAMVPVAAVAKALGLTASYSAAEEGPVVMVESEEFAVYLNIVQKLIYGSTKIEGVLGTTGPQDYGNAAYIEAPGTTWAPAGLFAMLGKTVTLEGDRLTID